MRPSDAAFDTLRARVLADVGAALARALDDPAAAALEPAQRAAVTLDTLLTLVGALTIGFACQQDGLPPPEDPRIALGVTNSLLGLVASYLCRVDPQLLRLVGALETPRIGRA